jgi:hypothetical protein
MWCDEHRPRPHSEGEEPGESVPMSNDKPTPDPVAKSNHEDSEYFKKHPIQDDAGYGVESEEEDDGGDKNSPRQS